MCDIMHVHIIEMDRQASMHHPWFEEAPGLDTAPPRDVELSEVSKQDSCEGLSHRGAIVYLH